MPRCFPAAWRRLPPLYPPSLTGDHVLAEENIYGCTYRIYDKVFKKFGISISYIDLSNTENYAEISKQQPTLVWIESPTNPMLKIIDIEAVANACHAAGTELLVDNYLCLPLLPESDRVRRRYQPVQHDQIYQRTFRLPRRRGLHQLGGME